MVTLNGELQLNTYGSEIASKGFSATGGEFFYNNIWFYVYANLTRYYMLLQVYCNVIHLLLLIITLCMAPLEYEFFPQIIT